MNPLCERCKQPKKQLLVSFYCDCEKKPKASFQAECPTDGLDFWTDEELFGDSTNSVIDYTQTLVSPQSKINALGGRLAFTNNSTEFVVIKEYRLDATLIQVHIESPRTGVIVFDPNKILKDKQSIRQVGVFCANVAHATVEFKYCTPRELCFHVRLA